MKKRYLWLLSLVAVAALATGCSKKEDSDVSSETVVESQGTETENELYISIEGLLEHVDYQVSAIDYNRLQAADGLILFGENETDPLLYIGQYEGLADQESLYEPESFLRGMLDSFIIEMDDCRLETYLVKEKYLSDYLWMTKSAIDVYIEENEELDEKTKDFLADLSEGIKLGSSEITFDEEKTSPYLQDNSKLFYEYVETDYDDDGTFEQRFLTSLATCTALGDDNYLVVRAYGFQQTDPLYDTIMSRYLPNETVLKNYSTNETDIFTASEFEDWIKTAFPYEYYERLKGLESRINNFVLRFIPTNIDDATEEELNAAAEAQKNYYKEKFADAIVSETDAK